LEVLFSFFARVDEDDLFFLFFDRSTKVGRTVKTILCGAAGTILVSVVNSSIFFFFLGGPLHG
jgi:hypothetical protein